VGERTLQRQTLRDACYDGEQSPTRDGMRGALATRSSLLRCAFDKLSTIRACLLVGPPCSHDLLMQASQLQRLTLLRFWIK